VPVTMQLLIIVRKQACETLRGKCPIMILSSTTATAYQSIGFALLPNNCIPNNYYNRHDSHPHNNPCQRLPDLLEVYRVVNSIHEEDHAHYYVCIYSFI